MIAKDSGEKKRMILTEVRQEIKEIVEKHESGVQVILTGWAV